MKQKKGSSILSGRRTDQENIGNLLVKRIFKLTISSGGDNVV